MRGMNRPQSFESERNHSHNIVTQNKQQPAGDDLVIDIHSLSRLPGHTVSIHRVATLLEPIGLDMINIPAGNDVDLDITLDMVSGGVYTSVVARADTVGECSRCLADLEGSIEVRIDELYGDPESSLVRDADSEDDDEVRLVEDETIDLSQPLIDAIGLALPWSPTCTSVMGTECINKDIPAPDGEVGDPAQHRVDQRWAALGKLFPDSETTTEQ